MIASQVIESFEFNCYRLFVLICVAILMGLTSVHPAVAQGASEPMREEMLVTARKRTEQSNEVPISISTFSTDQIEERGIRSLEDLSTFSPGFYFKSVGGFEGRTSSDLRFRGMDINSSAPWDQLGSVFVDGVYISAGVQNIGFENIERVEVIKGPQSAMFGRSTFGGAVNFVTVDPSLEPEGRIGVRFGQDGERQLQGWASGKLFSERLRGRLAIRRTETDGQYTNPTDGIDLGAQETTAISGTLVADATENLTAKLVLFWARDDDSLAPLFLVRNSQANCGPFVAGGPVTFCGELPAQVTSLDADMSGYLAGMGLTDVGKRLSQSGLKRDALRASLVLDWDLGFASLGSTTAWSDEEYGVARDGDLISNFNFFPVWQGRDVDDFQQELRLVSNSTDKLTWLIGANYYNYNYVADGIFGLGYFPLPQETTEIQTKGFFGSVDYQLTDNRKRSVTHTLSV